MPSRLDALRHLLDQRGVSRVQLAVSRCTNSAMGTPQVRCREMHQSGRSASMASMRAWPQSGTHFTRPRRRAHRPAGPPGAC
jgi:hypothetical protein